MAGPSIGVHALASGTTAALTTGSVTTAGTGSSFLVFTVATATGGTVTDSFSNTYSAITLGTGSNPVHELNDGGFLSAFLSVNGAGGSNHTATFTSGSGTARVINFIEIQNGLTSSPVDQSISAYATPAPPACSLTPTKSPELIVAAGYSASGANRTISAGGSSGYTALDSVSVTGTAANFASAFISNAGTTAADPAFKPSPNGALADINLSFFPFGITGPAQTITSAFGILGDGTSYPITAQTVTSAEGVPTNTQTVALTALTGTFGEGSLVTAENLSGQTATFTEGTITVSQAGNVTLALSGLQGSFAEGILLDNVGYVLDSNVGGITLVGQILASSEGTIVASPQYSLLAQTGTFTEGVFGTTGIDVFPVGQTLVSLEGTITAQAGSSFNANLGSQVLASSQGAINYECDYSVTAETLTSVEGTITFSSASGGTLQLTGQLASFTLGSLTSFIAGSMPNVVGLDFYAASQILDSLGLKQANAPTNAIIPNTQIPLGQVVAQSPQAGVQVAYGVNVQLTVMSSNVLGDINPNLVAAAYGEPIPPW